jgi:ABC-type Fe3+-hydroxamate transport system substrate-binding protein
MKVIDDRGHDLSWRQAPRRIVSLVPSISETIWHLGVGERLIAVTRYCTDPPAVRSLPTCGGTKNPNCEQIAALRPDLVLMSEEENRIEDYQWLQARGIPVFVSFPKRVNEVGGWISRLGRAVDCSVAAEALAAEVDRAVAAVQERTARRPRPLRVFCPIWKKPWMTFNADTYADDVLRVCGGENVFADVGQRYPVITLVEAAARAPALVLLPDEPYPFGDKDLPDLRDLLPPGGPARAAHVVDGQALSWYGVRTPRGLAIIEEALFGGTQ